MSCVVPPLSGNRLCGKPTAGYRTIDGIECALCAQHLHEIDTETAHPLEDTMPDPDVKKIADAMIGRLEKALYDQLVAQFGKAAVDRKMAERAARKARQN